MNRLISIVTPNYNCARFIAQTIESVLAQTYTDWEMLIVDDCSTDGSYEIALHYAAKDSRVKVFRMERNSGAAACRNKAIELSRGDYLAFLDSDDLWLPEKLERQLEFMTKNDADFSFTEYEHVDDKGKLLGVKARVIKRLIYEKMLFHCFTGCSTVLDLFGNFSFRTTSAENSKTRSVLRDLFGNQPGCRTSLMYKQDISHKIYGPLVKSCNDYALFLRVLRSVHNARGIPECLVKYRIRPQSLSRNKFKKLASFFEVMSMEHKNVFAAAFYLVTNQVIKFVWKYQR